MNLSYLRNSLVFSYTCGQFTFDFKIFSNDGNVKQTIESSDTEYQTFKNFYHTISKTYMDVDRDQTNNEFISFEDNTFTFYDSRFPNDKTNTFYIKRCQNENQVESFETGINLVFKCIDNFYISEDYSEINGYNEYKKSFIELCRNLNPVQLKNSIDYQKIKLLI